MIEWSQDKSPDPHLLRRMLNIIKHRGPDEFGLYLDRYAGLGSARLSIIDLSTGQQPITNEDRTLWIVFNGEIYNYIELRAELEPQGHRFSTHSDTEVILHLYEDLGASCLEKLNGQFAIAIWDSTKKELFLARDRLGIRPLFYTQAPDAFLFGSEIKTLLLDPRIRANIDPNALSQAFTFWAPLAPRTIFTGIQELPPGHYMQVQQGKCSLSRYWQLDFPEAGHERRISIRDAIEELRALLTDAARLRLRADVKVASYLSGGIDSTFIARLIREYVPESLCTFSIAFEEAAFDERSYQEIATEYLATDHRRTECSNADIGQVFPQVVWHAEAPLLRASPAPMYLLSKLVRENNIKVVLTGEGSDEFLGGYNIYREDKARRFWARQPASTIRPLLLRKLYPYVSDLSRGGDAYLSAFFSQGLTDTDQLGYSHQIRWRNTSRLQRLFSADVLQQLEGYNPVAEFVQQLDDTISNWSSLAQAQYIEVASFMSPYLLSSQGDRMMAANSVEGRFPFLDHRVVEFCSSLPPQLKILGLHEKHLLKKSAEGLLPREIWHRHKQPYRAPIHSAFFGQQQDYVEESLAPQAIQDGGYFAPESVRRLTAKCKSGKRVSEGDDMALIGVLSVQLLHQQFVRNLDPRSIPEAAPVRICRGEE